MRFAVVLLAALTAASARTLWHQLDANYTFERYTLEFGRRYELGSTEYNTRAAIFSANLQSILAHNADPTKTWKVRIIYLHVFISVMAVTSTCSHLL